MNAFFIIAGAVVTILGIAAIIVVSFAAIWVWVLGNEIHLRYEKMKNK